MVWGSIRAQVLADLHVVPQKQSVDAGYYVTEILQKSQLPSLVGYATTFSVLTKKMVPGMSLPIFQQDCAPTHSSRNAQHWLQQNVEGFWDNST